MALLIDNDVVERTVTMADAIEAVESGLTQLGTGDATYQRRFDIASPTAADGDYYRFGVQSGAIRTPPRLALRFKSSVLSWERRGDHVVEEKFNVEPGTYMGFILLFDTSTGALIGMLNDGVLQHLRTGATAGLACKYLAREDATTLGVLGSGHMARAYAQAIATVRDLSELRVYSPTPDHREAFADEMGAELGVDAIAVEDAERAVSGADVVATCTNSNDPVFHSEWLESGQLLVNVNPAEVDGGTYDAVDRILTTTNEPITENIFGTDEELAAWPGRDGERKNYETTTYPTLVDVLAGDEPGRRSDDETIFYNNLAVGGIQFAAIGGCAYDNAREQNLGFEVPLDWFHQSIKN